MGDDNDPRVFFAAEATLLAWLRTGLAIIGVGFIVAQVRNVRPNRGAEFASGEQVGRFHRDRRGVRAARRRRCRWCDMAACEVHSTFDRRPAAVCRTLARLPCGFPLPSLPRESRWRFISPWREVSVVVRRSSPQF